MTVEEFKVPTGSLSMPTQDQLTGADKLHLQGWGEGCNGAPFITYAAGT